MKKPLLLLISLLAGIGVHAQNPVESVDHPVNLNPYEVNDSLLSQLDLGGVTTGLLLDRAIQLTDVKGFDGQTHYSTFIDCGIGVDISSQSGAAKGFWI